MKIFAHYLPQFHRVPENDEWWGEGFTDWVSARSGKPLFEGHYQPRVPLNNNYYDLLEKDTMCWQADLMKKYGIDGVCVYHYWFKDGKRILEKPAENLLEWQDIDMPFCFYWANATWARSWSNIKGINVWVDSCDNEKDQNQKSILLEQTYGTKKDWEEHFQYLLPFFKDTRYICIKKKPLFLLYQSLDISCLQEMLAYWKKRAKEEGLGGLYVVGGNAASRVTEEMDAFMIHEPTNSMDKLSVNNFDNEVCCLDYKDIWEKILESKDNGRKTYYCGLTGFDDTPRRGKKGHVIVNSSPELFEKYLMMLLAKSETEGKEMVFLNAWNEWGEGMYLEPDEKFEMEYLDAVKRAKEKYGAQKYKYINKNTSELNSDIKAIYDQKDKFESYLNLLDNWMILKERNISLDGYLNKKGYQKIAIYGYGIFGRHLETDLVRSKQVELVCIVDKRKDKFKAKVSTFLPSEDLPEFDVLVVASYYFYNEIEKEMRSDSYDIISVETMIKDVFLSIQ